MSSSAAGGRRRRFLLSVVVLLIISVLQIWVCSDCKVRAIRVFPGNDLEKESDFTHNHNNNNKDDDRNEKNLRKKKGRNEDLFNKFFSGRRVGFNQTPNGFEENKRKIPSCPDPLHN